MYASWLRIKNLLFTEKFIYLFKSDHKDPYETEKCGSFTSADLYVRGRFFDPETPLGYLVKVDRKLQDPHTSALVSGQWIGFGRRNYYDEVAGQSRNDP